MSHKGVTPPEGPEQAQIEALLESFQPHPGERFYRLMANAPWTRKGAHLMQSVNRQSLSRVLTVSAFALFLLGIVAVMTLQGQTLPPAQENQPPTDVLESQPVPTETSQPPPSSTPIPEPITFSLTVSEAEALAGFDVLAPEYLPTGYAFQGAHYDSETQKVAMWYISQPGESGGAGAFYIFQQYGSLPEDTTPSAAVTSVPVGDAMGKFVRGAWVYEPEGSTSPQWEGKADVYTLSWQKDGMAFTIVFLGGETIPPVPLDELLAIAESMK
jgi:hypothetical protein